MSTRRPKQEAAPSLLHVMARASRALNRSLQAALEPHGVHAGQNFILERLWERDGLTPGEIAEAIGVEGPTVVRTLQRMAAAGIVVRKRHPTDGRQTAIHLTPAGSRLRAHVPRLLREVEEQALAGFSNVERPIARTFPLEQWREAMELSTSGKAGGKLLLLPTNLRPRSPLTGL